MLNVGKTEEGLILIAPQNATKLIVNDSKTGKTSYLGCDLSITIDNDKADNMITKNTVDKLEISLVSCFNCLMLLKRSLTSLIKFLHFLLYTIMIYN